MDVGGIYDPENLRFDHHQREFRNTFDENSSIKLSSAGLIYKHFGLELIGQLTGLTGSDLDYVYNRLYSDLIVEIDASDNGISRYDGPVRFNNSTSISCRVAALSEMAGSDPNSQFSHFEKAMDLFGDAFHLILENIQATLQYKSKTYDMIKNRFNYHPSGAILIQEGFLPTYTFIREFEDELGA